MLLQFLQCLPNVRDRKSTRLNSSHLRSSYAFFYLRRTASSPLSHYTTLFRSMTRIPSNTQGVITPAADASPVSAMPPERQRSEEHTSELQSLTQLVCFLLLAPDREFSTLSLHDALPIYDEDTQQYPRGHYSSCRCFSSFCNASRTS